jgi:hypothetical protein
VSGYPQVFASAMGLVRSQRVYDLAENMKSQGLYWKLLTSWPAITAEMVEFALGEVVKEGLKLILETTGPRDLKGGRGVKRVQDYATCFTDFQEAGLCVQEQVCDAMCDIRCVADEIMGVSRLPQATLAAAGKILKAASATTADGEQEDVLRLFGLLPTGRVIVSTAQLLAKKRANENEYLEQVAEIEVLSRSIDAWTNTKPQVETAAQRVARLPKLRQLIEKVYNLASSDAGLVALRTHLPGLANEIGLVIDYDVGQHYISNVNRDAKQVGDDVGIDPTLLDEAVLNEFGCHPLQDLCDKAVNCCAREGTQELLRMTQALDELRHVITTMQKLVHGAFRDEKEKKSPKDARALINQWGKLKAEVLDDLNGVSDATTEISRMTRMHSLPCFGAPETPAAPLPPADRVQGVPDLLKLGELCVGQLSKIVEGECDNADRQLRELTMSVLRQDNAMAKEAALLVIENARMSSAGLGDQHGAAAQLHADAEMLVLGHFAHGELKAESSLLLSNESFVPEKCVQPLFVLEKCVQHLKVGTIQEMLTTSDDGSGLRISPVTSWMTGEEKGSDDDEVDDEKKGEPKADEGDSTGEPKANAGNGAEAEQYQTRLIGLLSKWSDIASEVGEKRRSLALVAVKKEAEPFLNLFVEPEQPAGEPPPQKKQKKAAVCLVPKVDLSKDMLAQDQGPYIEKMKLAHPQLQKHMGPLDIVLAKARTVLANSKAPEYITAVNGVKRGHELSATLILILHTRFMSSPTVSAAEKSSRSTQMHAVLNVVETKQLQVPPNIFSKAVEQSAYTTQPKAKESARNEIVPAQDTRPRG